MTLAEQLQQYQGEWVLIEYTELDADLRVTAGRVIAHSRSKDEIYRLLAQTQGKNIAVKYVGEFPQDLAVMLAATGVAH
jgi:ribosome biogenesis SPOUT family RNA methylase Rps3